MTASGEPQFAAEPERAIREDEEDERDLCELEVSPILLQEELLDMRLGPTDNEPDEDECCSSCGWPCCASPGHGLELLLLVTLATGLVVEQLAGEQGRLGNLGGFENEPREALDGLDVLLVEALPSHLSISELSANSSRFPGMIFNASERTSFASAGDPSFQSASANKNQPFVDCGTNCVTRIASAIHFCHSFKAA